MSLFSKFVIAILSILIAFIALYIIEHLGYSSNFRSYFFGQIQDMGQLKVMIKADWIKGTKSVMFLLLAFFVLFLMAFICVLESVALIYFICSSRWRKPKVFISYKNSEKGAEVNTTKMALAIKSHLEKKGFTVLFFEYTKTLHHDNVNFEIQKMLRKCNAMVVIPDPYHPSYVDSEILYASTEQKPVFIIKHTKDQKLPNTANSGHTVLLWEKLKKENLEPLNYLLQYVHNYWSQKLFIIGLPFISFSLPILALGEEENLLKSTLIFASIVLVLVYFATSIDYALWAIKIVIAGFGVLGSYLTIAKIFTTSHFQKIIRQSILSGGSTYEHYVASEMKESVIKCIDKNGLAFKH